MLPTKYGEYVTREISIEKIDLDSPRIRQSTGAPPVDHRERPAEAI
jgi:hypothetical protein